MVRAIADDRFDEENEVGVVCEVVVDGFVDVVDDDCGWIGESGRRKKVGISSLSKKVMIRQARADYALVEIHLFDVLELSIRFCDLVGLIFVRREHQKL